MNERIKELIVESGNGQMRDGRLYPHIGIRFEEDWQRFAELIVRECVDIASKYDEPKMSGPGLMIGHMIEQHFGV